MNTPFELAPELQVDTWFNTQAPLSLAALRGRVVVLHAFQMLCPGCVSDGLPQATRVQRAFPASDVAVVGLHSVFEHHDVMNRDALAAFIHEYRLGFPIAVDKPGIGGPIPQTMQAFGLRGTPSLVVIDRSGRIRLNHFGRIDDLSLGTMLGKLTAIAADSMSAHAPSAAPERRSGALTQCDSSGCEIDPAS